MQQSHSTLVFGVRGVFALASGLFACITGTRKSQEDLSSHQNHWGGVSTTRRSGHWSLDPLFAWPLAKGAVRGRGVRHAVCQATKRAGNLM